MARQSFEAFVNTGYPRTLDGVAQSEELLNWRDYGEYARQKMLNVGFRPDSELCKSMGITDGRIESRMKSILGNVAKFQQRIGEKKPRNWTKQSLVARFEHYKKSMTSGRLDDRLSDDWEAIGTNAFVSLVLLNSRTHADALIAGNMLYDRKVYGRVRYDKGNYLVRYAYYCAVFVLWECALYLNESEAFFAAYRMAKEAAERELYAESKHVVRASVPFRISNVPGHYEEGSYIIIDEDGNNYEP